MRHLLMSNVLMSNSEMAGYIMRYGYCSEVLFNAEGTRYELWIHNMTEYHVYDSWYSCNAE